MATKQGMCRNCGSLVVFDDRDDQCECIFCNCVFPAEEAVALLENSEGHEFKNEKFEVREGGKHYYSNPVMPDMVQKAVQREVVSPKKDDLKLKPSEFEVSPSDVKAPKKLVIAFAAGVVAVVGIILAISLPLYNSRTKLRTSIEADIDAVFDGVEGDKTAEFEGRQFKIYGLSCQTIKLALPAGINKETAQNYYSKYCELRASKRDGNKSGSVTMEIFTPDTIFHVSEDGVTDNVQETVVITESTAATSESKK